MQTHIQHYFYKFILAYKRTGMKRFVCAGIYEIICLWYYHYIQAGGWPRQHGGRSRSARRCVEVIGRGFESRKGRKSKSCYYLFSLPYNKQSIYAFVF